MSLKNGSITIIALFIIMLFVPAFFSGSSTYLASTIFSILCTLMALSINSRLSEKNTIETAAVSWATIIGWGIAGMFLAYLVQNVTGLVEIAIFKQQTDSQNTNLILTIIRRYPYYLIATAVASPVMEELVFRKVFYGNLVPHTGKIGAAVLSSSAFALAHLDGHFLVYACLGFLFCYLYDRTHSIYTTMISHGLMNLSVVLIYLFVK